MTLRIRSLETAEPLVPLSLRGQKAPQVFREFVETLQRLHDNPPPPARAAKKAVRARPKARGARKVAK